jgi:hypothetical protein
VQLLDRRFFSMGPAHRIAKCDQGSNRYARPAMISSCKKGRIRFLTARIKRHPLLAVLQGAVSSLTLVTDAKGR